MFDFDSIIVYENFRSFAAQIGLDLKRSLIAMYNYKVLSHDMALNKFEVNEPKSVPENHKDYKYIDLIKNSGLINFLCNSDIPTLMSVYLKSKIFAEGPKLFSLSTEKCEALENVPLNLSCDNYEQPFPVMIAEFSSDYSTNRLAQYDVPDMTWISENKKRTHHRPVFAVMYHSKENNALVLSIAMDSRSDMTLILKTSDELTLEEVFDQFACKTLGSFVLNEEEMILSRKIYRTMCNLSMLCCDYGYNEIKDPVREKLLKKNNTKHQELNEINLLTRPMQYELNQNVTLFQKKDIKLQECGETGRTLKPHWRRGHWRIQAYGEGKLLRKRIFIHAVFVNPMYFGGDFSDITTNYNL